MRASVIPELSLREERQLALLAFVLSRFVVAARLSLLVLVVAGIRSIIFKLVAFFVV